MKRADLLPNDPLVSNGYTFENLYTFLSKYNSFFQKFVDELLPATIILKKSGLLVRNTIFTKQKFTYKRGVNIPLSGSTVIDTRHNVLLPYFGDDGSVFLIAQPAAAPTTVVPTVITSALTNIVQTGATGGGNVTSNGGAAVTTRGIVWSILPNPTTGNTNTMNGSGNGLFVSMLTGLTPNTTYNVRAYAINTAGVGYGNEISFATPAVVLIPSIKTTVADSVTQTTINNTGGYSITGYTGIDYYAMQYSAATTGGWLLSPLLPLSGPLSTNHFTLNISGLPSSMTPTTYKYRAYMVVSGSPYYGSGLTIQTLAIVPVAPTVTTTIASLITTGGTTTGGIVTSSGTSTVTARGVAYGLAPNPTISDCHTSDGTGVGPFTSTLTGLLANTTYFVKAYATSSVCTSYGSQVTFTTLSPPPKNINLCQTFDYNGDGTCCSYKDFCVYSTPAMSPGECYRICLFANLYDNNQAIGSYSSICIACNGTCKLCCCITIPQLYGVPVISFPVAYGDCVTISSHAYAANTLCSNNVANITCLLNVSSLSGFFAQGTTCNCSCIYTD